MSRYALKKIYTFLSTSPEVRKWPKGPQQEAPSKKQSSVKMWMHSLYCLSATITYSDSMGSSEVYNCTEVSQLNGQQQQQPARIKAAAQILVCSTETAVGRQNTLTR